MKRFTRTVSLLLCLGLLAGLLVLPAGAASSFSDVPENAWYAPYVEYVYENGIMNGTGNGAFSPKATTTRAMVVTILYRLSGSPETTDYAFSDVPAGKWYTDAISWAANHDVVNGTGNGNFSPNKAVTREQLVTMLYRYAQYLQLDVSCWYSVYDDFTDASSVSGWAMDACNWAVAEAIVTGVKADVLSPKTGATRAQIATIMQRFIKSYAIDPKNPQLPPEPEVEKPLDPVYTTAYLGNGCSLQVGMTSRELIAAVGQPDAQYTGVLRGTWYVYHTDDYSRFFMALLKEDKVYRIYLAGDDMSLQGYRIGDVVDREAMKDFAQQVENDTKNRIQYSFLIDSYGGSRLVGLAITDQSQLPRNPELDGYPNENDPEDVAQWTEKYNAYRDALFNSRNPSKELLTAESMVCFHVINAFRAYWNVQPLIFSDVAAATAQDHSQFMASNNNYTHDDPSWPSLADKLCHYGASHIAACGENITHSVSIGINAFGSWLSSEGHRAGMLSYTYAGVGAAYNPDSDYGMYWTTHFYNTYD